VEVLQARAKEIRNGQKKSDSGKQAPIKPNRPDEIQPDEARPAQPSLPVPKVVIPSKAPPAKPLPSVPSAPAAAPQFKYSAPIESTVETVAIIN